MKRSKGPIVLSLSLVDYPHSANIRDEEEYVFAQSTADDIALRGQQVPAAVERVGERYVMLQGFLRRTALGILQERGSINPATGKPFDSIVAFVYEDLTDLERYHLQTDHDKVKGLTKVGLFRSMRNGARVNLSPRDNTVMHANTLSNFYGSKIKKTVLPISEDGGASFTEAHHGTYQTFQRAWESPECLTEAFENKLRGKGPFLLAKDMTELHKVFTDECKADVTRQYSRDNPGPLFRAEWARKMAARVEADATGEKPKPTSMIGRQKAIDWRDKIVTSRILRIALDFVVSSDHSPEGKLPAFDLLVKELEALASPEWNDRLSSLLKVGETEES